MDTPIPHALFDSQLGLTKGNNRTDQQTQVWFFQSVGNY